MNEEKRPRRGSKKLTLANSSVRIATEKLVRHLTGLGGPVDRHGHRLTEELLAAAERTEDALREQLERIRHLEDLSVTDELTGLMNRRGFTLELERALARAGRHGETGVLLLCDLDGFKAVNDTHGHPAGDAVLREVSDLLLRMTRRSDVVARLGGDEFGLLLPATSPARASARALNLRASISAHRVIWDGEPIGVSASFGLGTYDAGSQADALMTQADRSLYERKGPMAPARVPPVVRLGHHRPGAVLAVARQAG